MEQLKEIVLYSAIILIAIQLVGFILSSISGFQIG